MVLAEGGVLIGLGIAIGFAGSVFTARLLRGLLFEVGPHDPTAFAAARCCSLAWGSRRVLVRLRGRRRSIRRRR
jgi:hypothetical protein